MLEFQKFDKIPRLSRDTVITEKIDGTNAQVCIISYKDLFTNFKFEKDKSAIEEMYDFVERYCVYKTLAITDEDDILFMFAGSRKRWLDCSSKGDNYGFAKWVKANADKLLELGEGRHYGEWYGNDIQRNYDLDEKRFALFNSGRWSNRDIPLEVTDKRNYCPECCSVVPVLYTGVFDTIRIESVLESLRINGSKAVSDFMRPEGIVIYHSASGKLFKKTIDNDSKPKG